MLKSKTILKNVSNFRMTPPGVGIQRRAGKDYVVGEYQIPKGVSN